MAPRESRKRSRGGTALLALDAEPWPLEKLRSDYEAGVPPHTAKPRHERVPRRMRVSRRIEKFFCAKRAAAIRTRVADTAFVGV